MLLRHLGLRGSGLVPLQHFLLLFVELLLVICMFLALLNLLLNLLVLNTLRLDSFFAGGLGLIPQSCLRIDLFLLSISFRSSFAVLGFSFRVALRRLLSDGFLFGGSFL